jgi:bacterioferritin-associated ferredoxin
MRVEAPVEQGAKVTVVAREKAALAAVEQRLGVRRDCGRCHRPGGRRRILADVRPRGPCAERRQRERVAKSGALSANASSVNAAIRLRSLKTSLAVIPV